MRWRMLFIGLLVFGRFKHIFAGLTECGVDDVARALVGVEDDAVEVLLGGDGGGVMFEPGDGALVGIDEDVLGWEAVVFESADDRGGLVHFL